MWSDSGLGITRHISRYSRSVDRAVRINKAASPLAVSPDSARVSYYHSYIVARK